MRLKEPFNGFKQAQGNLIYHFALVIGSLVMMEMNPVIDENNEIEVQCKFLLNCVRCMHIFVIISQFSCYFLDNEENDLFGAAMNTIELYVYQGTVLYELYFMLNHPLQSTNTGFQRSCKEWILIEMLIYFFQMFNVAIFLLYITIRGESGRTDAKEKEIKRRCTFDAIEYYQIDIEWLSFQLVMMYLHTGGIYLRVFFEKNDQGT